MGSCQTLTDEVIRKTLECHEGSTSASPWWAQTPDSSPIAKIEALTSGWEPERPGRFCSCLFVQDVEPLLGEDRTEGLGRISLPVLDVPLVRSCWLREQAEWVPVSPPLLPECLLGASQPGPKESRQWASGKAHLSLGLPSFSCCAGRIQACFANEPFSLWLNFI